MPSVMAITYHCCPLVISFVGAMQTKWKFECWDDSIILVLHYSEIIYVSLSVKTNDSVSNSRANMKIKYDTITAVPLDYAHLDATYTSPLWKIRPHITIALMVLPTP